MYKTVQLFTRVYTLNKDTFTRIRVIENTYIPTYIVIKNAKLIKAWIILRLFIVVGLVK